MTKNDIEAILDRICSGIASKSERKDARDELYDHIMNHYEKNKACGLSEEEAYSKAVEVLGDAETIGSNLKAIHNAKRSRRLLALRISLSLLAMVCMVAPWFRILSPVHELPSVNKITDVEMYSQITGNYHYFEDGHVALRILETVKMPIFPERIDNLEGVRGFKHITYSYLGNESEICCLVIDYSETDYVPESERLRLFSRNEAYKAVYGDVTPREGYNIITIYGDSKKFMYALSDDKHPGRIIYMHFEYGMNELPSRFSKDINKDYLLVGFTGKQDILKTKETSLLRYPPQLSVSDFSLSNTFFIRPYSSDWIYKYHLDLENSDNPVLDNTYDENRVIDLTGGELEVYKQDYEHKTFVGFIYKPTSIHGVMKKAGTGETVEWNFEEKKYLPEGEWDCIIEAVWNDEYYGGTAVYRFHFINGK